VLPLPKIRLYPGTEQAQAGHGAGARGARRPQRAPAPRRNASERTQSVWPARRAAGAKPPPGGASRSATLLSTPPTASSVLARGGGRTGQAAPQHAAANLGRALVHNADPI